MIVAAAAAVLVTRSALAAMPSAAELGAGVEAEPAEPQEARAEDGHRDVVRLHPVTVDDALADEQGDDQGGNAGRGVDDRAAGEVERARLEEPAVTRPDPVRDR